MNAEEDAEKKRTHPFYEPTPTTVVINVEQPSFASIPEALASVGTVFHNAVEDDPNVGTPNILPTDYAARKALLVAAVLDYFPLAIIAVSRIIATGQRQHGTTGWDRAKSKDHENTLIRHFLERGSIDVDGEPHSAKVAWRALALLQEEEEKRHGVGISRGSYDSSQVTVIEAEVEPPVVACEQCATPTAMHVEAGVPTLCLACRK